MTSSQVTPRKGALEAERREADTPTALYLWMLSFQLSLGPERTVSERSPCGQ